MGGESVQEICRDMQILITDLEGLIRQEGWVQAVLPGRESTEEEVNAFYKQGRMNLTTQMTKRAIKLFPKLMAIEDKVVKAVDGVLANMDTGTTDAPNELARVVNAYSKLLDKQVLLHEAIATPALADKKIESLLKNTVLSDILDKMDGKGRVLPCKDNEDDT